MYIPKHFDVTDNEEIFSFVEENAFGQLISQVDGRLFSSHIPFLISKDRATIFAHLAKPNPQLIDIEKQEVMLTFEGPHDYISPSWYTGSGVPTWNYQTAHIYGRCTVFNDADRLKELVDSLTHKYESGFETPWQPEYNSAMLGAIAGIEIQISDVQCKYKLSQNRSENDRKLVIQNLTRLGSITLAKAMERDKSE